MIYSTDYLTQLTEKQEPYNYEVYEEHLKEHSTHISVKGNRTKTIF